MRLLSRNEDGTLQVSADQEPSEPYAILSHTWGPPGDEILFQDVQRGTYAKKAAMDKIDFCLKQAQEDGYRFVWVDTCCIDKTDRNELGEAINRMFEYYTEAAVCYVYLADIEGGHISRSRWFTRGWTLQELVAPRKVMFYSNDWRFLGDRASLRDEILAATQIDTSIPLAEVSLAERYQWSTQRQTTKAEDMSYCLLGLLEVNLLFNYGEGGERAQARLLQEIEQEHGKKTLRAIRSRVRFELTADILLASLEFDEMYSRRANIRDPYSETCRWILSHPSYKQWLQIRPKQWKLQSKPQRFLWIKGRPGTGKSTLLRFAEQESPKEEHAFRLSFYFNARGSHLESTTLGMYRSLLLQILKVAPELEPVVVKKVKNDTIGIPRWTVPLLQSSFKVCLTNLPESCFVQCFIDALDECDNSEAQEMVNFLQDLSTTSPLLVCFASRYYPAMSIRGAAELLLDNESNHNQDLLAFVEGRLDVPANPSGAALINKVVAKARGIFFWAVLVVDLLNQELRTGSVYNVQQTLEKLPGELIRLIEEIIARDTDNEVHFRSAIQWILFAASPLSVKEYYFAMVTTLHRAGLAPSTAYSETWHGEAPDIEQMALFVSSTSRGLAEVIVSRPGEVIVCQSGDVWRSEGEKTVQFIHESVRDFLLQYEGLKTIHKTISHEGDLVHWIFGQLAATCQTYLIQFSRDDAAPLDEVGRMLAGVGQWDEMFPFMNHAIENVLNYANRSALSQQQHDFIQDLDGNLYGRLFRLKPPSNSWQGGEPNESSRFSRGRHNLHKFWSRWFGPIGTMQLLASCDADRLIREAAELRFQADDADQTQSPLFVAVYTGSHNAARALLALGANHTRYNNNGETALLAAVSEGDLSMCRLLLETGADATAQSRDGISPLNNALEQVASYDMDLRKRSQASPQYSLSKEPEILSVIRLLIDYGARLEDHESNYSLVSELIGLKDAILLIFDSHKNTVGVSERNDTRVHPAEEASSGRRRWSDKARKALSLSFRRNAHPT